MSTTTGADLLAHADRLTRQLRVSEVPVTRSQWETFDVTLHRLLHELVNHDPAHVSSTDPNLPALAAAVHAYPQPLRPVQDRPLSPREAAQQLGQTTAWVHAQIRRGNLHAVHDGRDTYIPARPSTPAATSPPPPPPTPTPSPGSPPPSVRSPTSSTTTPTGHPFPPKATAPERPCTSSPSAPSPPDTP